MNSQAKDGLESFCWRVFKDRSRSGRGLRNLRTELGLWRLPRDEDRTGLWLTGTFRSRGGVGFRDLPKVPSLQLETLALVLHRFVLTW